MSLLLHLLLGVWMVVRTPPPPPAQPGRPGEIWFEEPEPTPPLEAQKDPEPPAKSSPARTAVRRPAQKSPASDSPTVAARSTTDAPRADTPRAPPSLVPSQLTLNSSSNFPVEPSRGETIHPDDPRFDPDVIAARERQRVKARVDGWAEDGLAEARAQNGLPHPYLMALRDAGRKGLTKLAAERGLRASPALAAKVLAQRYTSASESYGKGGNPELGPPGQAPRLSERLTLPEQQPMRGLAQATETFNDLSHGKPLLTLTLEFRQSKTRDDKTTIIKASIDPSFDAFVLDAWPLSIAKAGPPPNDAYRTSELRSIWEIEGWPGATPLDKTMTYLPEAGVMGIPITRLIPAATGGLSYEFRARLLRVY